MTTNEIIAMAREAGARSEHWATKLFPAVQFLFTPDDLSRFAALVAAKEREACERVCDHYAHAKDYGGNVYMRSQDCKNAATAIRARCAP